VDLIVDFPQRLRLIDERAAAFRAAVAAASDLDAPVPSCPGWTLLDLARHIGEGRQAWAATVAAGPDATAKAAPTGPPAPHDRDALTAWLATSTGQMLTALEQAGPERGCWTWWTDSQSPPTCAAVARHQLQEVAVHTYDAQLAIGAPQPLPTEVALDGVDDFLLTCCATTGAWPHRPAVVDYHATEGTSWRVHLSAAGAHVDRLTSPQPLADVSATGTASELVLFFYSRIPPEAVNVDGDARIFDQLFAWDPTA
jgi:uncharacterized protein (TIGR03083 family)